MLFGLLMTIDKYCVLYVKSRILLGQGDAHSISPRKPYEKVSQELNPSQYPELGKFAIGTSHIC